MSGYFASTSVNDWFSIDLPAWAYMIVIVALLTGLAWFHIEVTSKILGVFLVTELIGLLIFGFAILFSSSRCSSCCTPGRSRCRTPTRWRRCSSSAPGARCSASWGSWRFRRSCRSRSSGTSSRLVAATTTASRRSWRRCSAGLAQIGACYLLIKYRRDLSGAADNWFVKLIPWFVVAIFVSGIAAALHWRGSNPEKYQAIGRFVHEDA